MKLVQSESQLAELLRAGDGVIYNDFAPSVRPHAALPKSAAHNTLHDAHCGTLQVSLTYTKYYSSDLDNAVRWLIQNRGEEGLAWHRCGCLGAAGAGPTTVAPRRAPEYRTKPGADNRVEPFRESDVEAKLTIHLSAVGYEIQSRVRVASGIIDFVAAKDGERLVVEAKGEDGSRDRYTAVQMGFLIGIGQLASRMTDEDSRYALAFPRTPDFLRVVKTFLGSRGFARMGIDLLVVAADGSVEEVPATSVADWIASL